MHYDQGTSHGEITESETSDDGVKSNESRFLKLFKEKLLVRKRT